jgi:hypothetical protein
MHSPLQCLTSGLVGVPPIADPATEGGAGHWRVWRAVRGTERDLDDSLWISGSPIDCEWLRRERIDLVVDVADPQLRLEPQALGHNRLLQGGSDRRGRAAPWVILGRLVDDVVTAMRAGRRVLVACAGGRNRSGLVVGLAVRELLGCSGSQSLHWVQSRRENALNDATFARHLAGRRPQLSRSTACPLAHVTTALPALERCGRELRDRPQWGGRPPQPGRTTAAGVSVHRRWRCYSRHPTCPPPWPISEE